MATDILSATALGPLGFVAGSGLKLLTHSIGSWITNNLELTRQRELALINADTERIRVLQSGEDRPDILNRITRVVLAILFMGTYCFLLVWMVVNKSDLIIQYPVEKSTSFVWELLSPHGVIQKGILEVSLLGVLSWGFITLVPFIAGFYFTKIGR